MEKEKSINIRIQSIEETSVNNNCGGKDLSGLSENALVFQFKVNAEVSLAKKAITVTVAIKYKFDNMDLFQAECVVCFLVDNLEDILTYDKSNNTVTFSFDVIPTLVNASFGTLRGIVYKETKNGPLEKYPVPLIPMKVLVEKCAVSMME